MQELINRYGLKERLEENNFSTYKADTEERKLALIKSMSFIKKFDGSQCMLLQGQVGAGKTHLALAIMGVLLEKYTIVPFMYTEEIGKLRIDRDSFYEENQEHYRKTIDKYKEAQVLLIEDLFWGKKSEKELEIAYEIINYRYNRKKPMIITTELTRAELLNLNEALASRIIQRCGEDGEFIIDFGKNTKLNARLA